MAQARSGMTEAQTDLFETLDDVAEHVSWEFNPDEYEGVSTCGFASIKNIDGRSSLVQRAKALADNDAVEWVYRDKRNPVGGRVSPIAIEVGSLGQPSAARSTGEQGSTRLELLLSPSHDSGYRLSISNVSDLRPGPEHQRMDVRERLHRLVLNRLQYNGYCESARVYSRMD